MKNDLIDKSSLKKYRTEIPNIVFHLGLTPYELSLYVHIKRAAGAKTEGRCTKSGRRLAEEAGMSHPMMLKAKARLASPFEPMKRPLISVEEAEQGKRQSIEVEDIWDENSAFMLSLKTGKPYDQLIGLTDKPDDQSGKQCDQTGKPCDQLPKKEPIEEETNKELSPHSRMMDFLQVKYGPIANGAKEGRAIKWLLDHGYDPAQCEACFDHLAAQEWRTIQVSWVTVQTNIGSFLNGHGNNKDGNGHKPTASEKRVDQLRSNLEFIRSGGRVVDS